MTTRRGTVLVVEDEKPSGNPAAGYSASYQVGVSV